MLVGSSVGFFRRGSTIACFCETGRTPASNEQLNRNAITGASVSLSCFRSQVKMGSSWHVLDGTLVSSRSSLRQWRPGRTGRTTAFCAVLSRMAVQSIECDVRNLNDEKGRKVVSSVADWAGWSRWAKQYVQFSLEHTAVMSSLTLLMTSSWRTWTAWKTAESLAAFSTRHDRRQTAFFCKSCTVSEI